FQATILAALLVAVGPGCKQKAPGQTPELDEVAEGPPAPATSPTEPRLPSPSNDPDSRPSDVAQSVEVDGEAPVPAEAPDSASESAEAGDDETTPAWACSSEQAPPRPPDWLESLLRKRSPQLAAALDDA